MSLRRFVERDEDRVPFVLDFPHDDFPAFLERLASASRGEDLPAGFVPHSTFWLVRDGETVVAVSNLRHTLNDRLRIEGGHIGYGVRPSERRKGYATELLRRTLVRAAERGISRALVTCDRENIGSVRAIERNGGVLDGQSYVLDRDAMVERYWIDLAADEPRR